MDLEQRLRKRYKVISDIESFIKESVYYRSNNSYFDQSKKIIICNTKDPENKAAIQ